MSSCVMKISVLIIHLNFNTFYSVVDMQMVSSFFTECQSYQYNHIVFILITHIKINPLLLYIILLIAFTIIQNYSVEVILGFSLFLKLKLSNIGVISQQSFITIVYIPKTIENTFQGSSLALVISLKKLPSNCFYYFFDLEKFTVLVRCLYNYHLL